MRKVIFSLALLLSGCAGRAWAEMPDDYFFKVHYDTGYGPFDLPPTPEEMADRQGLKVEPDLSQSTITVHDFLVDQVVFLHGLIRDQSDRMDNLAAWNSELEAKIKALEDRPCVSSDTARIEAIERRLDKVPQWIFDGGGMSEAGPNRNLHEGSTIYIEPVEPR